MLSRDEKDARKGLPQMRGVAVRTGRMHAQGSICDRREKYPLGLGLQTAMEGTAYVLLATPYLPRQFECHCGQEPA